MFDGLRSDADEPVEFFTEDKSPSPASAPRKNVKRKPTKFLGLDARQRFVLSLMLMFAVCMLGTMCMFITQKFVIP